MKRIIIILIALISIGIQPEAKATDSVIMDTGINYDELKKHLLKRYSEIVVKLASGEEANIAAMNSSSQEKSPPVEPDGRFLPWWQESVTKPLAGMPRSNDTKVGELFVRTISHSSQMKVFADLPLIRRTTIQEADGEFDTHAYANGHLSDVDEPVGDTLKTGGPDRYHEQNKGVAFGLSRKFVPGTEVKVEQQFNRFDNNSEFLDPHRQSRTRTGITITQPLLKGFGPAYNYAPEDLAKIDFASAGEELQRQISGHLLEVVRAYWGLYMERSLYLQKQKLAQKTEEIYQKMQTRVALDVQPSLLARTKSQILAHKLDADEAKFSILNAQSRLWALVNDPELVNDKGIELVTSQEPTHRLPAESMRAILEITLQNRPEINQSIRQIQAAALRHYRSQNELFPELNLFAEAYTNGLKGNYDDGQAYRQEWDEGDGSYSVGLRLDFPLFNNAASARAERKKLEIRQLVNQLDTTVSNVLLEAQVSYRETIKYHMAMARRYEVLKSTEEEYSDLLNRIDLMLSRNDDFGAIQYQLLDAIERLNKAELEFSSSELTYNLALYQLKNAKGMLLNEQGVQLREEKEDDLPANHILISPVEVTSEAVDNRKLKNDPRNHIEPPSVQAALDTVETWKKAWQAADAEGYLATYSNDFIPSDNSDLSGWKNKRSKVLTKPKYIRLGIDTPVVKVVKDDQVVVSFIQTYESDTYNDRVDKTLTLQNEPSGWKIIREQTSHPLSL